MEDVSFDPFGLITRGLLSTSTFPDNSYIDRNSLPVVPGPCGYRFGGSTVFTQDRLQGGISGWGEPGLCNRCFIASSSAVDWPLAFVGFAERFNQVRNLQNAPFWLGPVKSGH